MLSGFPGKGDAEQPRVGWGAGPGEEAVGGEDVAGGGCGGQVGTGAGWEVSELVVAEVDGDLLVGSGGGGGEPGVEERVGVGGGPFAAEAGEQRGGVGVELYSDGGEGCPVVQGCGGGWWVGPGGGGCGSVRRPLVWPGPRR